LKDDVERLHFARDLSGNNFRCECCHEDYMEAHCSCDED